VRVLEVWTGGVNPWEVDGMGHLNVRYYVAKSMEGLASLTAEMGMPRVFAEGAQATLRVREQHIRFLREARPGGSLTMTGGVVEMGETDARIVLVMHHLAGEPAASFQFVVEHVTAGEGRPFPWPQAIRDRAGTLKVAIPPHAAARSLDLAPLVKSQASLARALELDLIRIGLGVLDPADCDAFGRMRPEQFMSRISDGMRRLGRGRPGASAEEARMGGAALEYRLIYLESPRAGDRIEIRSAFSACDDKTRRLFHWMLDPESGRPWGVAEAIVVSFDLETRKIISMSPAAKAAFMKTAVPQLTL
jgi:acyl-CoA thioester hydrolase